MLLEKNRVEGLLRDSNRVEGLFRDLNRVEGLFRDLYDVELLLEKRVLQGLVLGRVLRFRVWVLDVWGLG